MRKKTPGRIPAAGMVLACLLYLVSTGASAAARGEIALTVKQALADAGTFTYRLRPAAASNPMPAGSGADGYSFSITGAGERTVGPITFTQAGIYIYELSPINSCACALEAYALKVYVENDLSISVVVTKPDGTKAIEIKFAHTCGKPEETTKPETTAPATGPSEGKPGPVTGDESQIAPYVVLLGAAGAAVLGSAAYLLAGRRRRKGKNAHEA